MLTEEDIDKAVARYYGFLGEDGLYKATPELDRMWQNHMRNIFRAPQIRAGVTVLRFGREGQVESSASYKD